MANLVKKSEGRSSEIKKCFLNTGRKVTVLMSRGSATVCELTENI